MANDMNYTYDATKGLKITKAPDQWPEKHYKANELPACRKQIVVLLGRTSMKSNFTGITYRPLIGDETPATAVPKLCAGWRLNGVKPHHVNEHAPVYLQEHDCMVYIYRLGSKLDDFMREHGLTPRQARNRINSFVNGMGFFNLHKPECKMQKLPDILAALHPKLIA